MDEYVRLPSGRYQVSLPWKSPGKHELGELRNQALKRFVQNERNLLKKEKLDDFNKVLSEYESLRHTECCQLKKTIICRCMAFSRLRQVPPNYALFLMRAPKHQMDYP